MQAQIDASFKKLKSKVEVQVSSTGEFGDACLADAGP
jgi:hypothetical protein